MQAQLHTCSGGDSACAEWDPRGSSITLKCSCGDLRGVESPSWPSAQADLHRSTEGAPWKHCPPLYCSGNNWKSNFSCKARIKQEVMKLLRPLEVWPFSFSWTDNHLCSRGWAGFAWSPVVYLALLRTSKMVPRQHAREKKKGKKNKNVPHNCYYSSILSFARTHILRKEEISIGR